jgi:hypothetical protein
MTVHRPFLELAARSIDASLSHDQHRELRRHLVDCDACRAYEAGLRTDALAVASVQPLEPPPGLDQRIRATFASTRPAGQLSPVLVLLVTALVMAAAVGAALGVGAFVRQQVDARLPQRPDTPAGWTVATATSRDVRVALPPYAVPFELETVVMANEDPSGNSSWFQVTAIGPQQTVVQPEAGQSPADWLLSQVADPERSDVQIRDVALPAGQSVEVRATYHAGTPEETRVLMYAIATADGYAMLQIVGRPEDFANHRADIGLIPFFLEAGPMLAADIGPGNKAVDFEFELPSGWDARSGPAAEPRGDDFVAFISNAPIPDAICEADSHGADVCYPEGIAWGPDEFLLSVLVFQGGTPRHDPLASPLPGGVELVTVAGQPASRLVDPDVLDGDRILVTWELHAPDVEYGFWLITMNAGRTDFGEHLAEVQAFLESARLVTRD